MNYEEYKFYKVKYPKHENEVIPKMFKARVIQAEHPSALYDHPERWQRLFTDGHNVVWNDLQDRKTKAIDESKKVQIGDVIWVTTLQMYNLTIKGQKWHNNQADEPDLMYEPRFYLVSKV